MVAAVVDTRRPCQATITLAVVIAEPVTIDGSERWRPIAVDNTSLGVELIGHNHQQLIEQIRKKFEEYKALWQNKVISVQTSQVDVKQAS